ncbi:MAG TPA: nucleotide exchange factor GrpE [Oscillospiraceae bacterium]|nr:nucleotide exchange factor GrpE [Oscillospiraceae bacterium]HNW04138.1 nucleotide exchange factor GrpE [Oscillospiraceae bacterium]HPV99556.1 nucleotide exchange factor GrpE [Oscillospiraceae bacterium]
MKNEDKKERSKTPQPAEAAAPAPETGSTAGVQTPAERNSVPADSLATEPMAATKLQAELEGLKAERDALQEKCDELGDRYLRALAEYDNFRKRTQREKDAIYGDAIADAVAKLLPILDSFERAREYPCADENFKKGIDMICNSVEESFASLGVAEIPAEDQHFDPNLHNAVLHAEDPGAGENMIAEVFRKGYRLGDRVLRFTMVKVVN